MPLPSLNPIPSLNTKFYGMGSRLGNIHKTNKDPVSVERKKLVQEIGCKGTYSLQRTSSHNRVLDTPVDPMHLYSEGLV